MLGMLGHDVGLDPHLADAAVVAVRTHMDLVLGRGVGVQR